MLYPVCVGKEEMKEIKQIIQDQLDRLPEISLLTTSSSGQYYKDKETTVQPIPSSFFTVFASKSNSTRLNPTSRTYFFITSAPPSVLYQLDRTDQSGDSTFKYFNIKLKPSTST